MNTNKAKPETVADVLAEMRDRKVNHGKHTSPTLVAWADRIERAHAAGAGQVPPLAEDEMQALRRFDETTSDDGSTDLPEEMLGRLVARGALRRLTSRREWVTTDYGWWLLSAAPDPKPAPEAEARVVAGKVLKEYWDVRPADPDLGEDIAAMLTALKRFGLSPAHPAPQPPAEPAAHSPASNGATEPCDALDGAGPCACGAWHAAPAAQAETGAHGSAQVSREVAALLSRYARITIDEHTERATSEDRVAAMQRALTECMPAPQPASAQGDVEALNDAAEFLLDLLRFVSIEANKCDSSNDRRFFDEQAESIKRVESTIRRLASAQPATAKPAGDAEFKVGDRVEWTDGMGDTHSATVAMAVPLRFHLETDGGIHTVLPVPASSITRLTGGAMTEDERILWGVVANAGQLSRRRTYRWGHVMDATGIGSQSAISLCRRFGFDQDEMVGGEGREEDSHD